MEKQTTIVEINGVKLEVDLRTAKKIEHYQVGGHIKVLVKDYDGDFRSYIGTIIGFDNFDNTPTIVIAYLKTQYASATIEFVYWNSLNKKIEICPLNDWDVPVSKQQVLDRFDLEIEKKKSELSDMENKKNIFLKLFGKYFENEFAGISTDNM